MSVKNKKQFGVWMDSHHATILGREHIDSGDFILLGHATLDTLDHKADEYAAHNSERTQQAKFFKDINAFTQNMEEVHVTGTGQVQEQFIHYMAGTPQFKNVVAGESTSNKMSTENLIEFITKKFN
jgi:stalled ribosome rescue protein Dom34